MQSLNTRMNTVPSNLTISTQQNPQAVLVETWVINEYHPNEHGNKCVNANINFSFCKIQINLGVDLKKEKNEEGFGNSKMPLFRRTGSKYRNF